MCFISLLTRTNCILSCDGTIHVWDTADARMLSILEGQTCSVLCLTIFENKLYSGSCDSTIRVWDIATHECIAILKGHNDVCIVSLFMRISCILGVAIALSVCGIQLRTNAV